jgi:uncharacterized protein
MLLIYIIGGVLAGVLSSWVGAGGASIIIPLMLFICKSQGMSSGVAIHLSVSTSLAFITVNSLYNAYQHYQSKNIIPTILKKTLPALIVSAIIGSILSIMMTANIIEYLFLFITLISLIKTFSGSNISGMRTRIPSKKSCATFGSLVGVLSSVVGIGGSAIVNPYMKHYNFPMRNCAAMASALAVPAGIFGTISMFITSYHVHGLPTYCLGYLYLPALVCLLGGSCIGTRIGIKIVNKCPENISIWVFRALLSFVIINML